MKKLLVPALFTVFIVGGFLVPFRDRLPFVWAAKETAEKVETIQETQQILKDLYLEQKTQNTMQDLQLEQQRELTAVQIEALKELVKELRQ